MKSINTIKKANVISVAHSIFIMLCFALIWYGLPKALQWYSATSGTLDNSIWLLLLFGIISFLSLAILCGWMVAYVFAQLGLPKIQLILSQFKTLTIWQQFAFYWASFALLLLASVMSLAAVF